MEDGLEQNRSILLEMMDRKKANQDSTNPKPEISKPEISKPEIFKPVQPPPLKKEEK